MSQIKLGWVTAELALSARAMRKRIEKIPARVEGARASYTEWESAKNCIISSVEIKNRSFKYDINHFLTLENNLSSWQKINLFFSRSTIFIIKKYTFKPAICLVGYIIMIYTFYYKFMNNWTQAVLKFIFYFSLRCISFELFVQLRGERGKEKISGTCRKISMPSYNNYSTLRS